MMYLLDTNIISELRKVSSGRAHSNVIAWSTTVTTDSLYISAISLMELEANVLYVEKKDARQGELLRRWLDEQVVPAFSRRILPVDAAVASCCAGLSALDASSLRGAFIAATAMVHGMTLVTRHVDDFSFAGLKILNPWL